MRAYAAREPVTHCKHGHAFTKVNTYVSKRNTRICRRCQSARGRARYFEQRVRSPLKEARHDLREALNREAELKVKIEELTAQLYHGIVEAA